MGAQEIHQKVIGSLEHQYKCSVCRPSVTVVKSGVCEVSWPYALVFFLRRQFDVVVVKMDIF